MTNGTAYYNEYDVKPAAWLRELIKAGEIEKGQVDERSISDVRSRELSGFERCHFFAGIGGWDLALRLAGWPEGREVWTGSCPCQPFSVAGKRRGTEDERHLWPEFLRLIAQCRPATVFGEQVASADGRQWLSGVRTDLEALGYAVGGADLCAAGVGAPHIRQRLYWVAKWPHAEPGWLGHAEGCDGGLSNSKSKENFEFDGSVQACGLADGPDVRRGEGAADGCWSGAGTCAQGEPGRITQRGNDGWLANNKRLEGRPGVELLECENQCAAGKSGDAGRSGSPDGGWGNADWILCMDGKWRRVESGSFPLADGVPGRVGLLRGYGNAIVPQVAAQFVRAFLESE